MNENETRADFLTRMIRIKFETFPRFTRDDIYSKCPECDSTVMMSVHKTASTSRGSGKELRKITYASYRYKCGCGKMFSSEKIDEMDADYVACEWISVFNEVLPKRKPGRGFDFKGGGDKFTVMVFLTRKQAEALDLLTDKIDMTNPEFLVSLLDREIVRNRRSEAAKKGISAKKAAEK